MDNSIKTECDKLSVAKDIAERQSIIHKFETTGFLDRNEAINKVTSLQNFEPFFPLLNLVIRYLFFYHQLSAQ